MADDLYPLYGDGRLDGQVRDFLLSLMSAEPTPAAERTPEVVRAANSIREWLVQRTTASRVDDMMACANGRTTRVRVYSPGQDGPYPVVVYFHGGGWVFGTIDEADHICSSICMGVPAVVVSVDYGLSPEHRYPSAIEEAYASVAWAAEQIGRYGGDPGRIAVAGESAGANMATVVALMARDRGGPRIRQQLLLCPWVDLAHLDTESYRLFGEGCWLSRASIECYRHWYLESESQAHDPYVSPLLAPDLRGLPPAHVITAEFDVLRDEGEAYARRLQEEGNTVTCRRYEGMIHSFFVLNGVLARADEAIADCVSALKRGL